MQTKIDQYKAQDLIPPEWKLLQNTGGKEAKQEGAKPGQFYHTLRGDVRDELLCAVVDIIKTRTLWRSEIKDVPPLCTSDDADSMTSRDGKDCRTCEKRCDDPWNVDAAERRGLCTIGYVLLGIELGGENEGEPFIIRCHGISVSAIRELLSSLRLNRKLGGEYYRAQVKLRGVEKDTPQGPAYALQARPVGLLDDPQANALKPWVESLLGVSITPQIVPATEKALPEAAPAVTELEAELPAEEPEPEETEEQFKLKF